MPSQAGDFRPEEFTVRAWDPQVTVAVAEGILGERYRIPTKLAARLLLRHAAKSGLTPLETARRLLITGQLPHRNC